MTTYDRIMHIALSSSIHSAIAKQNGLITSRGRQHLSALDHTVPDCTQKGLSVKSPL